MKLIVDGIEYTLTTHAKYRMGKRNVSMDNLVECLSNIKFSRLQEKEGCETRTLIAGRNKVTVVLGKDNVIITVYGYSRERAVSKSKNGLNKQKRMLKKRHGNRYKG